MLVQNLILNCKPRLLKIRGEVTKSDTIAALLATKAVQACAAYSQHRHDVVVYNAGVVNDNSLAPSL